MSYKIKLLNIYKNSFKKAMYIVHKLSLVLVETGIVYERKCDDQKQKSKM